MPEKKYKCPTCKKELTKEEYDKVLGIVKTSKRNEKAQLDKARREGVKAEQSRTQLLLAGKDKELQKLKERLDHLKRGTTPQTQGFAGEESLVKSLQTAFPEDAIEHKGKRGDVLQTIYFNGNEAATIIYECKVTSKILISHIRQTITARELRKADAAILVTTGTRKGFNGFINEHGIYIVSPLTVVHIADFLRRGFIALYKANLPIKQRETAAHRLSVYLSNDGGTIINKISEQASYLEGTLREEMDQHWERWQSRYHNIQYIQQAGDIFQENIDLILAGKEPKQLDTQTIYALPNRFLLK